jgi:hypothetical protein
MGEKIQLQSESKLAKEQSDVALVLTTFLFCTEVFNNFQFSFLSVSGVTERHIQVSSTPVSKVL